MLLSEQWNGADPQMDWTDTTLQKKHQRTLGCGLTPGTHTRTCMHARTYARTHARTCGNIPTVFMVFGESVEVKVEFALEQELRGVWMCSDIWGYNE